MTDNKVLDRIKKLLALAQSSNVNEASNAAAAASKLMAEHQIAEAMLAATPEAANATQEPIGTDVLHSSGGKRKLARWAAALAVCVCEVNGCKCYVTGAELRVIGKSSDAQTARYLFAYLVREVDRLCDAEARSRGNPGRTWCNNFRIGAMQTINSRLREGVAQARRTARQEAVAGDTLGTGAALVRVDHALARMDAHKAAIEAFGKRLGLRARAVSRSAYDSSGREAGRRAGATVSLTGGRPLGSGVRGSLRG